MSLILKVFLLLALITIMIPGTFQEINWIELLTLTALIGVGIWTYFKYRWGPIISASKMWQLGFDKMDNPENWNWPPAPAIGRGEDREMDIELRGENLSKAIIPIRVKAKQGVTVPDIDIRFVVKQWCFKVWPPWEDMKFWKWNPLYPVNIEKVRDVYAERFLYIGSDDYPRQRDNCIGGVTLSYVNPKRMLAGDSLWLILEISCSTPGWVGYLEFMGPTPVGNLGCCRRKITICKSIKKSIPGLV